VEKNTQTLPFIKNVTLSPNRISLEIAHINAIIDVEIICFEFSIVKELTNGGIA